MTIRCFNKECSSFVLKDCFRFIDDIVTTGAQHQRELNTNTSVSHALRGLCFEQQRVLAVQWQAGTGCTTRAQAVVTSTRQYASACYYSEVLNFLQQHARCLVQHRSHIDALFSCGDFTSHQLPTLLGRPAPSTFSPPLWPLAALHLAIDETVILLTLSLSITIDTPTDGRGGCSRMTSLVNGDLHRPPGRLRPDHRCEVTRRAGGWECCTESRADRQHDCDLQGRASKARITRCFILLHSPSVFSWRFNRDGEGASATLLHHTLLQDVCVNESLQTACSGCNFIRKMI